MSDFKVFYSWQSDLPNATNRGFIGTALANACEQVSNNPDIEDSPRVDQDTQGLPGSPAIPAAIMEKIDECQAFIADVSLCFSGPNGKVAPNPNVIYELGYAVARLGWDRVILIVNEEFGKVELLPFDLEKRRAIPYTAKEGETDRSDARKALIGRLVAGIEAIALRQPIIPKRTPADEAIEAVENQIPARKARIRDLWSWVMGELRRLEPDLRTNPPKGEFLVGQIIALEEAIANIGVISVAWSKVCEAIALADDRESAEEVVRGFGSLLVEYDFKPDYRGGHSFETWFDFWRFCGHEFYTVFIGSLLKESRWSLIDSVLSQFLFWERKRESSNKGVVYFDEFSVFIYLLDARGKSNRRLSYHADLLSKRYGPEGIGSRLSFSEFMDSDLFLCIAGELRLEPGYSGWLQWRPWSVLYMRHEPRFLLEAISGRTAGGVKQALGEPDSNKVRQTIKERVPKLRELWPNGFWDCPLTSSTIDQFDSKL